MLRSIGWQEKAWDAGVWIILAITSIVVLVPLWYVVTISFAPFDGGARSASRLLPTQITLEAYRQLFAAGQIPRAFLVSVYVTLLGTVLNLIATTLLAYPLSRKGFRLRNVILLSVLFTILFNGGLVPTYLIVRNVGLTDTYWSLMIPNLVSAFNLLVMKAFFQNLPNEIEEAARMDGASDIQVFLRIVLPLSKPILATIGLFYAVSHWNSFFDALLYISDARMQPLQVILRTILTEANLAEYSDITAVTRVPLDALRMAAVVLTTLPVLMVYPFLQRYFTSGVLLGSIKE